MLSAIKNAWPPAPGADQSMTGWKMMTRMGSAVWVEDLRGLHMGSWWTGLRLTAAGEAGGAPAQRYRVRLVDGTGREPFLEEPGACTWEQLSGEWAPLPWPIPADLATSRRFQLVVEPVDPVRPGLATSVRITFHDMPDKERYIFVAGDGTPRLLWDGGRNVWGTPFEGAEPIWRTFHTVVPPMARILNNAGWAENRPYCCHGWDDRAQLD